MVAILQRSLLLLQTKAGTLGAGVIVLIDCADCSFNDMKRFILAVRE